MDSVSLGDFRSVLLLNDPLYCDSPKESEEEKISVKRNARHSNNWENVKMYSLIVIYEEKEVLEKKSRPLTRHYVAISDMFIHFLAK